MSDGVVVSCYMFTVQTRVDVPVEDSHGNKRIYPVLILSIHKHKTKKGKVSVTAFVVVGVTYADSPVSMSSKGRGIKANRISCRKPNRSEPLWKGQKKEVSFWRIWASTRSCCRTTRSTLIKTWWRVSAP